LHDLSIKKKEIANMFQDKTTYRVRYADVDQMEYMYYGHYARLYEIGRAEMVRKIGFPYKELESKHKIMMPVIHMECRYLRPAKYDDLITIKSELKEIPTKLICFHHEIINEENELLNKGLVKLFFIDIKTQKRISTPQMIINKLEAYFA